MRNYSVIFLDAPSNLGLRPPAEGTIPGCYKMPWKLRDLGLLRQVDAIDAGCVVPPLYSAVWQDDDGDRNADAIASYSIELADRVGKLLSPGNRLLVVGGDCSILIGN